MEWGNLVNIKYFYLQKAFGKILNGRLMAKIKNEALGDKFAYEQATETYGRRKYLTDWKGVTYSPSQESVLGPVGFALYFFIGLCNKNTDPQTVQDRVRNATSVSNQKLFLIIN